jgi:hypothetical protein
MPLYFFHVYDGKSMLDDTGTELADVGAAKAEALQFTGELLKERHGGELFWDGTPWRLEVTDGPNPGGRTFFVMHFSVTDGPTVADPRALRMTSWNDENIPAASRRCRSA